MSARYYIVSVTGHSATPGSHTQATSLSVLDSVDCHREVYRQYVPTVAAPRGRRMFKTRLKNCERVCAELNALDRKAA